MIPQTCHTLQSPMLTWQQLMADCVTDARELLRLLQIAPQQVNIARFKKSDFPLRVPRGFIARMNVGDVNDPLLRQVLPLAKEAVHVSGFCQDPLNESAVNPIPGLLHKYHCN